MAVVVAVVVGVVVVVVVGVVVGDVAEQLNRLSAFARIAALSVAAVVLQLENGAVSLMARIPPPTQCRAPTTDPNEKASMAAFKVVAVSSQFGATDDVTGTRAATAACVTWHWICPGRPAPASMHASCRALSSRIWPSQSRESPSAAICDATDDTVTHRQCPSSAVVVGVEVAVLVIVVVSDDVSDVEGVDVAVVVLVVFMVVDTVDVCVEVADVVDDVVSVVVAVEEAVLVGVLVGVLVAEVVGVVLSHASNVPSAVARSAALSATVMLVHRAPSSPPSSNAETTEKRAAPTACPRENSAIARLREVATDDPCDALAPGTARPEKMAFTGAKLMVGCRPVLTEHTSMRRWTKDAWLPSVLMPPLAVK
mmetsp:Transcript_28208/g.84396  ORF Transcript_28208/g.84396 Transcript_28208/m.84396 type:complete len:368 (+) Transcript_28208:3104-4207(+)